MGQIDDLKALCTSLQSETRTRSISPARLGNILVQLCDLLKESGGGNDNAFVGAIPLTSSNGVGVYLARQNGQRVSVPISLANNDHDGLMSVNDKIKLNGMVVNIEGCASAGTSLPLGGKVYHYRGMPVAPYFITEQGESLKKMVFVLSWGDDSDWEHYGIIPYKVMVFGNSGDDSGLLYVGTYEGSNLPSYISDFFSAAGTGLPLVLQDLANNKLSKDQNQMVYEGAVVTKDANYEGDGDSEYDCRMEYNGFSVSEDHVDSYLGDFNESTVVGSNRIKMLHEGDPDIPAQNVDLETNFVAGRVSVQKVDNEGGGPSFSSLEPDSLNLNGHTISGSELGLMMYRVNKMWQYGVNHGWWT